MATNKILFIPEWKITATTSTPDSGFSKIYPKSDGYWYVVDDSGNEKRLELAIYPKNGLVSTSFSPSNPYGTQLDVSLGSGLTFSGDFVGSTINVSGITPSMLQAIGTPTASYILSTDGTDFTWSPFTSPGISGSTNKIAKFSSNTTLTDSLMSDDGSKVVIGTTPSFAVGLLNVDGDLYASGNLYITDDVNTFATYNQGWLFQTDKNFRITDDLGYKYLNLYSDNISTYTFSILDDKLTMSDNGTFSSLLGDLNLVSIGSTLSTTTFSISSDTQGALQIKDGTEGLNKLFVSDSDGVGSWYNLTSGDAISINGLTISLGITGYGLTISSNLLELDYGIFGSSLTYSTGVVNLPLTGVTAGVYGGTLSSTQLTVDEYGRITEIASYDINFPIYDDYVSSPLDKNAVANDVTVDGGTATNTPISINPIPGSYVAVFVNGQEVQVGNATTNSVCYFGTNSVSPKGFSVSNSIQSGDYLYWNPSIAGYDLESGFRIAFHYLVTPASLSIFGTTGATGPQGPQGATGPQGPQGVTGPTGSAESLAVTLGVGNTTGGNDIVMTSGDLITSLSSNSQIELDGLGGGFEITSDNGNFNESYIYGGSNQAYIGYGTGSIIFEASNINLSFGSSGLSTIVSDDGIDIDTIFPSSYKGILVADNSSLTGATRTISVSGDNALFLNSGSIGADTVFNQSVNNSVAVGGSGLTVKTSNTAYANQISLQPTGNTSNGLLVPPSLTDDRTYTFQDASGTVAFISDIGGTPSLSDVMSVGNTTSNNLIISNDHVIKADSGNALINLRAGGDDVWIIGNQIATFSQYSGFIASDGSSLFGGVDLDGWGFSIDNNSSTIGNYDSPTASIVAILPRSVNVVKQSFIGTSSIQSSLAISDISSNTFSFSGGTGEAAVSINSGDGNNTVFNAGVARSVAVGGRGLIVKTDNTAYMNQIALQNITSTFEGILGINTLTSDQTWVFPDKSGFIALTDDILSPNLGLTSIGGSFSVDVNSDSLEISSNKVRLKDSISGDRTFLNSVSINGNLTVLGTTSNIHTENLYVEDNIITLNATFSGSPILNAGIEVNRGTETYSTIIWNESINYWQLGLSGSESTIITEAGSGLSKSNNTLSADYETLANQLSGNGLTANGGVIDVNTSNGLGIISDSVALGGTLSQNTTINLENNTFKILSSNGFSSLSIQDSPSLFRGSFRYINGSTQSSLFIYDNKVDIGRSNLSGDIKLELNDSGGFISDTINSKGFEYLADYSANFTTYSLIDKNYVDTRQFDSLSDVVIGFDTGSASVDDDGKLLYYDFNNSQFTTDEVVTYGTSIINCKTSVLTGTVSKGLPVYITGFDSDLHVVELADASTKNPVIGFTAEQLDDTNSSKVITFGKLTGINTTNATTTLNPNGETWVVGDILYISTTTGGLTKTRPTANTSEIQRVAKVLKVDATGGQLFIFNTFRTAGLPNLKTNYHWVGNGSSIPTNITYSKDITIQEFTRTETLSVREGLLTWLASSSYNGYYITSFIGKVSTLNDNVTYQINRNGIGLTATSNTISSSSGTTITGLSYSISTGDILQIETTSVGVTPSNGLVVSIVMQRFI